MREPSISDAEADEVLAGRRPEGRDDLARVADAMAWLRIQSQTADPPQMAPELRERLTVPLAGGVWRARQGARASAVSLAAAATILLGLVVSGSQGMLPGPVQTVVADVGDAVGVAFPRPPGDPDVVSGPGGSEWPNPYPDGGPGGGDGESAADEETLGATGDDLDDDGVGGDDEASADRWCDDRSPDDWRAEWDPEDWPLAAREHDQWERDDWSAEGRAGPAWRPGGSPDGPLGGADRGVDPEQQRGHTNWAGRSPGGDGPVDGDGDGRPDAEWCRRAGAAGH